MDLNSTALQEMTWLYHESGHELSLMCIMVIVCHVNDMIRRGQSRRTWQGKARSEGEGEGGRKIEEKAAQTRPQLREGAGRCGNLV